MEITETVSELNSLKRKQHSMIVRSRLQMLLFIKTGDYLYQTQLADKTGYNINSIKSWVRRYRERGMEGILDYTGGGTRPAAIQGVVSEQMRSLLSDPENGISSYIQIQHWLRDRGVEMSYHAVYNYLRRHFKTKLKVGRKSHIKKKESATAAFKKSTLPIKTH